MQIEYVSRESVDVVVVGGIRVAAQSRSEPGQSIRCGLAQSEAVTAERLEQWPYGTNGEDVPIQEYDFE